MTEADCFLACLDLALSLRPLPTTDGHTVRTSELDLCQECDSAWSMAFYHRDSGRPVHLVIAKRRISLARPEGGSVQVDLRPGDVLVPIGAVYNLDPVNRWPL